MGCDICGSDEVSGTWTAREMQYGTRDAFTYAMCGDCGCLRLVDRLDDPAKYYGAGYYSTAAPHPARSWARRAHVGYLATGTGLVGAVVDRLVRRRYAGYVAPHGLDVADRLLEVGCGNGAYLYVLAVLGHRSLWGVDPFMHPSAESAGPIRLERRSLLEVSPSEGPVDVLLFDHSLEHIAEQHATMARAVELLAPGGVCVVRIPTVSSWAWEHYGVNWAQLDAPRHIWLHSRRSLVVLAERHGLTLERMVDDSWSLQFWCSERYAHDIPMRVAGGRTVDPAADVPADEMREYEARASVLNAEGRGDQFTAYLRKGTC